MGRMSLLVSTLVILAVGTTALGLAFLFGLLAPGPGGVAVATSPPPRPTIAPTQELPTEAPTTSLEPSLEPTPTGGPTVQPSPGGTHIVQPGESLSSIGLTYGVPWQLIAEVNGIEEPYVIQVGQEILIPIAPDPTAGAQIHIVQPGESIISIATLYGVDPTELADANPDILDWNLIYVGQPLIVPDGSSVPEPEPSETPAT